MTQQKKQTNSSNRVKKMSNSFKVTWVFSFHLYKQIRATQKKIKINFQKNNVLKKGLILTTDQKRNYFSRKNHLER